MFNDFLTLEYLVDVCTVNLQCTFIMVHSKKTKKTKSGLIPGVAKLLIKAVKRNQYVETQQPSQQPSGSIFPLFQLKSKPFWVTCKSNWLRTENEWLRNHHWRRKKDFSVGDTGLFQCIELFDGRICASSLMCYSMPKVSGMVT